MFSIRWFCHLYSFTTFCVSAVYGLLLDLYIISQCFTMFWVSAVYRFNTMSERSLQSMGYQFWCVNHQANASSPWAPKMHTGFD